MGFERTAFDLRNFFFFFAIVDRLYEEIHQTDHSGRY